MPQLQSSMTEAALMLAHGTVQRIDLIARELTIRQECRSITYNIPPTCEVLLNGERVKLRLLQPRDQVRITHRIQADGRTALSIEAVTRFEPTRVSDPARVGV